MKRQWLLLAALLLAGCTHSSDVSKEKEVSVRTEIAEQPVAPAQQEQEEYKEEWKLAANDVNSVLVLVNKQKKLPEGFVPANMRTPDIPFVVTGTEYQLMRAEAADAAEQLFRRAEEEGIYLFASCGYRSYENQRQIYEGNVARLGQEGADAVSAMPGASEHQTGLAMDVTSDSVGLQLEESFAGTKEGQWLAAHAHEFGFIVRYPKDKTEVTGYSYEPWHIRYIGIEQASYLYKHGLTLEEVNS